MDKRLEVLDTHQDYLRASVNHLQQQQVHYQKQMAALAQVLHQLNSELESIENQRLRSLEHFMSDTVKRHQEEDIHKQTLLTIWRFIRQYWKAAWPVTIAAVAGFCYGIVF